ncbi:MAG: hypothetical protein ABIJ96_08140 [Elusimicrobiota bacterium]
MPAKNKKKKTSRKSTDGAQNGIKKELHALGRMIQDLVRDAAKSPHMRGVSGDIKHSVRSVGRRLHAAIEDVKKSEQGAKIKSQAKKVFTAGKKESLKKSKTLRVDIARGLDAIAKELSKIAGTIEK